MGITQKWGEGVVLSPQNFMKEKITQTLFTAIFLGSLFQAVTTSSIYVLGFSLFTMGCSGAILLGALFKYFSQEEIDLRDIRRERKLIAKQKQVKAKPKTIKSNKLGAKAVIARK
jgi:hypothetical protein